MLFWRWMALDVSPVSGSVTVLLLMWVTDPCAMTANGT